MAARLTFGRSMPLSKSEVIVGNVLFQSLEDDLSDTLLPRCISAGADLSRIESIDCDDTKRAKAVEIICSMLQYEPKEGTEIFKACNEAGISTRTVERVKKE